MEIISRKDASARSLKRYFTGKPCKNGHIDDRDTPSGRCISCIRSWSIGSYYENRDEVLAGLKARRKVDEKFAERARASARAYYSKNKEKVSSYVKRTRGTDEYRAKRREAYAENSKFFAEVSRRWRQQNPEKVSEGQRNYRINNAGKLNAKNAARARRIVRATPHWSDLNAVRMIYEEASAQGKSVDHIVPVSSALVCGLHVPENLRIIDLVENQRKGNRHWPDMPS